MKEKNIILTARAMSLIFTPFYLSIVGLAALFIFSYMNMYPWQYKLWVLGIVYFFTILLPTLFIYAYRRYRGWTLFELGKKERRVVPYFISIICYFFCYYVMHAVHIPHFMSSILVAALMIQIVCAMINLWWKISTHTAAIGGVAGALLAFALIFSYNPVWWLCGVILLAGLVGSSRMILRQHTLTQVVGGFFVGLVTAYVMILSV